MDVTKPCPNGLSRARAPFKKGATSPDLPDGWIIRPALSGHKILHTKILTHAGALTSTSCARRARRTQRKAEEQGETKRQTAKQKAT